MLFFVAPLVGAVFALILGKEAGWDLLNYHWYVPYAWLNQRLDVDIAVAHHSTYYNPLIDLPLYGLAHLAPAWVAGAVLGALFGLAVALYGSIAYEVLQHVRHRLALASGTALLGAMGGGALSALGNSANDVVGALGILAALWWLLRRDAISTTRRWYALPAGLLAGLSVGLKLTMATYAIGLLAAMLLAPQQPQRRWAALLMLSMGLLLGVSISAGPWMWQLWEYSGNPMFPYFNHVFHSPLLLDASYRDPSYLSAYHGLSRWWFPLTFTLDSLSVAEWKFRDVKLLLAYVLVPSAALFMWRSRSAAAPPQPSATGFLFTFAAFSYLPWLYLFSVYRYLIPLEMLAPLLIVLAIHQWPTAASKRLLVTLLVLLCAQLAVQWNFTRDSWQGEYVEVKVPAVVATDRTMILMSGKAPMAYVIPSFPTTTAFLRIDGWLVGAEDHRSGLAVRMRQRVARHEGPLWMLFAPYEEVEARKAAQSYHLELQQRCLPLRSNVADDLLMCELKKV